MDKSFTEYEDPEIVEAKRLAEEQRKERHRKKEEERETMRQDIRQKVSEIEPVGVTFFVFFLFKHNFCV